MMVPHNFLELYNFSGAEEMGLVFRVMNRSRISLPDSYIVTKFEGIFFYEILFWENRRNKSVDCTFSLWLCQANVLMISVAAALLRNSSE